ncbi:MAG: hypothetical protein O2816_09865 [Planctomycetota bacterium]|nr:hypothetical protein [Planctomycetota bacterium]
MTPIPGGSPARRMTLAEAEAQTARDKRKIIILAVGTLLLFGAYMSQQLGGPKEQDLSNDLPMGRPVAEVIHTLPIDSEVLEAVADATADQRLIMSGEAVDLVLKHSETMRAANYDALGAINLDARSSAELLSAPAEHRGDALRVRGVLLRLGGAATPDPAVKDRQLGAVELEDGTLTHIAFLREPRDFAIGDFIRLDGLFVQAYNGPGKGGLLTEGALVVGNQLQGSRPSLVGKDHAALAIELREKVKDDTIDHRLEQPFDELWDLMAFARERKDDIDWSTALELDNEQLGVLSNDGTLFRGQPYVLNICQNMGTWVEAAEENGLRIPKVTYGWIGNNTWKDPAPLITFIAPFEAPELQDRKQNRLVSAKGFFLRNHAYNKRDGKSAAIAPVFVLSEIKPFVPPTNHTTTYILIGVVVGTALMILVIFLLVRADSRNSTKLQEELTRRRRERRARAEASPS